MVESTLRLAPTVPVAPGGRGAALPFPTSRVVLVVLLLIAMVRIDGGAVLLAPPRAGADPTSGPAGRFVAAGAAGAAGAGGSVFDVSADGYRAAVGPAGALVTTEAGSSVAMELLGAGVEVPGRIVAGSRRGDPAPAGVEDLRFDRVLPGTDLVWTADGSTVEYSFVLDAGADPTVVALDFGDGVEVRIAADGAAVIGDTGIVSSAPITYQDGPTGRSVVDSAYELRPDGTVGFSLGPYDPTRPLVIDPTFRVWDGTSGKSTVLVVPVPAGVVEGDLLLAAVATDGIDPVVAPAGWTTIRSDGTSRMQSVFWRIATASEPATYTFTIAAERDFTGVISAFAGVDPLDPIDAHAGQENPTSTTWTAPSVTTTVPGTTLVTIVSGKPDTGVTPPAGMIERAEELGAKRAVQVADEHRPAVGATGARTASGTSSVSIGQTVALRPVEQVATLLAGTGGGNGGDDLVTIVDLADGDPATNETNLGTGTGTSTIKAMDADLATRSLVAAVGGQLGVVSPATGTWSAIGTFGTADGAAGTVTIDDVNGLAFDGLGNLYGVENRSGTTDLLFRVDPATGVVVADAFGAGVDYVVIQGIGARNEVTSIAIHPYTGVMYAGIGDDSGAQNQRLATIDLATGATSTIGDTDPPIITGLAVNAAGELWGSGHTGGSSYDVYRLSTSNASTLATVPIDNGGAYEALAFGRPPPTAIVNSLDDDADASPGDGFCDTGQTNTALDPECTLRAAIQETNASSLVSLIQFDIPDALTGGEHDITPDAALPTVTATVTIDGTTEPDSSGEPVVVVAGTDAGAVPGLVLGAAADGSEVRGLVVRDWGGAGIDVEPGNDGSTIVGNHVGRLTAAGGDAGAGAGNAGSGIRVRGTNTVVGGADPADANLLSGNDGAGVSVEGEAADATVVEGNLVGVDGAGTALLGNGADGVTVSGGGDDTLIVDNLVAHPGGDGVEVAGASTGTVVRGNTFGTDLAGTADLSGRDAAVTLSGGADETLVGGLGAGEGNVIANAGSDPANPNSVTIESDAGSDNAVLGNELRDSRGIGIDLGLDGPTPNDAGDGDAGPNGLLNTPVLTAAEGFGGWTTVTYDLDVPANPDGYRVEFYRNPGGVNGSGNHEAETFVDAVTTAPGTGLTHLMGGADAGDVLTATVTRIDTGLAHGVGGTSEVSPSRTVSQGPAPWPDGLWLTTLGDVGSPSGAPGLDSWSAGSLLVLGDPGLAFEPPVTAGTFDLLADLDLQGKDGDLTVVGLDLVETATTVGTSPSVDLLPGDLLLSTAGDETYVNADASETATLSKDVVLFRPSVPGDFSSGTFSVLLDQVMGNVNDVSLVESATTVGDTLLPAGSLLLTDMGEVHTIDPVGAGPGVSPGATTLLVDGADLGLSKDVAGLHLVDDAVTVDGVDLFVGDLLLSHSDAATGVGDSGIAVTRHDVFALRLTATTAGSGTATGDATLLVDGSDVGLDTNAEDVRGTVLVGGTPLTAPIAADDLVSVQRDATVAVAPLVNDLDPNGDPLSVVAVTQPADGTVVDDGDGTVTYTPDAGFTGSDSFTYTAGDGTETDTATVTVTVRTPELWTGTVAAVTSSGTTGLTDWSTGELLSLGDPGLVLDPPTTAATVGVVADLDALTSDGLADIGDVHLVTRTLTLGASPNSFTLEPGDVLLTTNVVETFVGRTTSVTADDRDVVVFRPDQPGAPTSTGEFHLLLDDPLGAVVNGMTLVEITTPLGDTVIPGGTLLLSSSVAQREVWSYGVTATGAGTTTGVPSLVADIEDLGLAKDIAALDLVEEHTVVGGRSLTRGLLLVSPKDEVTIAGLPVQRFDVAAVDLATTTIETGTTTGSATLAFDGSDTGFDDNTEALDALSLSSAPVLVEATGGFQNGVDGYIGTVDTWFAPAVPDQDNSADTLLSTTSSPVERTLIRFDDVIGPGAGQIPPGATITSATLTFVTADPSSADATLSLHRMLRSWVETDTYNTLGGGVSPDDVEAAATPDGTVTARLDQAAAPVPVGGLDAAVQAWANGEPNDGWLAVIDRTDSWDARSSETAVVADRPRLVVTWVAGPLTLVVNSTGDAGDLDPGDARCDTGGTNAVGDPECTLRAAIEEANVAASADTIEFAVPDTDAGYQNLGAGSSFWRIQPSTSLPVVSDDGIVIDATTQTDHATGNGFLVNDLGPEIELVGTTAGGTGLEVAATGAEVRGFVINRFATGIELTGGGGSTVAGNYIGTAVDGATGEVGNTTQGIRIDRSPGNVIGGPGGTDRNVISGNRQRGIAVDDWSDGVAVTSAGTQIVNNHIGVDRTGLATVPYDAVPNHQQIGVYLLNTSGTVVGTPSTGNVISGHPWYGIYVWGSDGSGNVVQNNIVGLDAAETGSLPNGTESTSRSGVLLSNAVDTLVGGVGAGEGNTIATNAHAGVVVQGASAADNAILGNRTYGNGALGIDLGGDDVTPNDVEDADGGPNDLLNVPVLTSPLDGATALEIGLDVPADDYRIEVFTNPTEGADPTGAGEGETLVHAETVTVTGAPGSESFTLTGLPALTAGEVLTATATVDLGGGAYAATSEFSAAVVVRPLLLTVNATGDGGDATPGDGFCDTGATNADGDPACTLRAALEEAAASGIPAIEFAIPSSEPGHAAGVWTIDVSGTALPAVSVAATTLDATTQPGWGSSPVVVLDGTALAGGHGLQVTNDGVTVRGLALVGFPDAGVRVTGSGVTVAGNHVGVGADGATVGANGTGVRVEAGATDVTVGGLVATDRNVVVGNTGDGVEVVGAATGDVAVVGNRITGNGGLAIDLVDAGDGPDGVTPNDPGDADTGPNGLLNVPVVGATATGTSSTAVTADLDVALGDYRIEWFVDPSGADPSGYGEAAVLVATQVVTHPGGTAQYGTTLAVGPGTTVTATLTRCTDGAACTDPGATAEVSAAVVVAATGTGVARPLRDSSGNRQDGRSTGGMGAPDAVAAALAGGLDLDGADDQLLLDNLDLDGPFTTSAWVRSDAAAEDARVLTKESSDADADKRVTLSFDDSTSLRFQAAQQPTAAVGTASPSSGAWTLLAGTWDGSTLRLYQDGVLLDTQASAGTVDVDPALVTRIGGAPVAGVPGQSRQLDGQVDEVRVLRTARSAGWLAAEHANQAAPSSFVTIGDAQVAPPGPWTVASGAGRGGSFAAEAPDSSPGAWLLASGLDEPGLLLDSWWRVSTLAGVEVGQGVRAVVEPLGPVQDGSALQGSTGWDLGQVVDARRTQLVAPPLGQTPAAGTWHRVVTSIDQDGELAVAVDGVPVTSTTGAGARPSGTAAFRIGALPAGEDWWIDDVRARRYVVPEPTTSLGPLVPLP